MAASTKDARDGHLSRPSVSFSASGAIQLMIFLKAVMIERRAKKKKRKKKKQEFGDGLDSIQKMEMEKLKVTIQGLGREKDRNQMQETCHPHYIDMPIPVLKQRNHPGQHFASQLAPSWQNPKSRRSAYLATDIAISEVAGKAAWLTRLPSLPTKHTISQECPIPTKFPPNPPKSQIMEACLWMPTLPSDTRHEREKLSAKGQRVNDSNKLVMPATAKSTDFIGVSNGSISWRARIPWRL